MMITKLAPPPEDTSDRELYESIEDRLWYLKLPRDMPFMTTKDSIEEYVGFTLVEYLKALPDGISDQYRCDESDWDKALDWVMEYIGKCVADLKNQ